MMRSTTLRGTLIAGLCTALPTLAAAQSLWPDPLKGRAEVGLEWVRPTFENGDDALSGTRGVWILSGRVHATQRLNAVIAIPRLVATDDANGATSGDPYFGVEFLREDGRPEFSLGGRIDMVGNTSSSAPEVALFGDFDRFEEALPHAFSLTATGYHEPFRSDDGTFARIRFGATFLHPTGEGAGAENEMYVNYGIRIGRETPALRLSAELTGRWWLNGNAASLAEGSVHQGAVTASFFSGQVRPSVGFRIPIDENLKGTLAYALTFGLTLSLE